MPDDSADRFAACCSDALFGYAEAASAMWWAITNQTLDVCGRVVKAAVSEDPSAKPASWFNPNPDGKAHYGGDSALGFTAPAEWMGLFGMPAGPAVSPFGAVPATSPIDVWFNMFPLRGTPAAWPMAFFMLSAGVPKAVAWPTATANAAMMEAAEVATGQLKTAFANYRSDSGYAAAPHVSDIPFMPQAHAATTWPISA